MLLTTAVLVVTMKVIYNKHTLDLRPVVAVSVTPLKTSAQGSTAGSIEKSASSSTPTIRNHVAIAEKPVARSLLRTDQSVVGQPFEISASVKQGCVGDTVECPLVFASVARMIQEPRDIDWAVKMEEKIQAAVEKQRPGAYMIRNLECRTTICILELECHDGPFVARYDQAITSSLRPNALTIGVPEYDSSGASYRLELMDFERQ
jgi:hypothetical protein